jgi:hypothetical protein
MFVGLPSLFVKILYDAVFFLVACSNKLSDFINEELLTLDMVISLGKIAIVIGTGFGIYEGSKG